MVGTALQHAARHRVGRRHIITGLLQNIQDVKDHEEELIQARRLAERAELKQSFLNNMSHEIRTPLNAIAGFANLLVYDPELSETEKREYAGIIDTNTKLLLKLVDDVLQLSRMETANMSFDLRRESVRHLLEAVYRTHSVLIKPPLEFIADFPAEDAFVHADRMRLTQVVTNFLNNAGKFTSEGHIRLGYVRLPATREVSIYVEDTGIGIPQEEREMIFARFYKRSEFSQGVGLGAAHLQSHCGTAGRTHRSKIASGAGKPVYGGAALRGIVIYTFFPMTYTVFTYLLTLFLKNVAEM